MCVHVHTAFVSAYKKQENVVGETSLLYIFPWACKIFDFSQLIPIKSLMSQTSLSPQCSINDGAEFKAVADAMKVIGFKQEEIETVYKIVAAILHLVSTLPSAGRSGLFFSRGQGTCASSSSNSLAAEAVGRPVDCTSVYSLQLNCSSGE